jgi:hypothetical protein
MFRKTAAVSYPGSRRAQNLGEGTQSMPDDDSEFETLILFDAIGRERDGLCHPCLVFDEKDGPLTVADDYETVNDPTARDFILTKDDALRLIGRLIDYVSTGTTSTTPAPPSLTWSAPLTS